MRATIIAAAMVSGIGLSGCDTVPMVNGVAFDVHTAQGGGTFCGRNSLLCLTGGALLAGGVALAASSGHGSGSGGDPPAAASSGSGSGHRTPAQIP